MAANAGKFVGKGDVHGTVGVFHHFRHLRRADIGKRDFALTERGIQLAYLLALLGAVSTDGAVVMEQFVDHIARDNPFGGVRQVKRCAVEERTDFAVDRTRRNSRLYHRNRVFRRDFQQSLHSSHDIRSVGLLCVLVVRRGYGDYIHLCALVFRGKTDSPRAGIFKEAVQSLFLKGQFASGKFTDQCLVQICAYHLDAVRCKHQSRGQADIS